MTPFATNDTPAAPPITLTRDGNRVRLSFPYDRDIVDSVKHLPQATFDRETLTWSALLCAQSVSLLRGWARNGLTDRAIDSLLEVGEEPAPCPPTTLHPGTEGRPFLVRIEIRDDEIYQRLKSIPTAQWDKKAQGVSFGPGALARLSRLVDDGTLADPRELLNPAGAAGVTVAFDSLTGAFVCRGDDRAQPVFDKFFPKRDVVAAWAEKGLAVAYADPMTEQVYRGELARTGSGLQPEGLQIELYPYQAQSVAMAVERTGLGIYHAPGLGKSSIAIAAGLELLRRGDITRVVLVVPGAIRTQWRAEINKFTGVPIDQVTVVHGTPKQRTAAYKAAAGTQWLVVSYDLLNRDFEQLQPLVTRALIVADEAHRLKNFRSQRSQAARKLAPHAARRLCLTGTPVLNDAAEFYAMLDFAVPGSMGTWFSYGERYLYPSKYGGRGAFEGIRPHMVPELRRRAAPHFIRYTKEQVATHLPPLRVQHLALDPTPAYANMLRRLHRDARDEIAEQRSKAAKSGTRWALMGEDGEAETGAELTAVGMLRMAVISPRLLRASDSPAAQALIEAGLVPDEDGPKVDEVRALASELQGSGERAVVFTFSTRMVDLLKERFDEDGIRYVTFTGEMPSSERDASVAAFNSPNSEENPPPTIFLATDAAAEGLNLGKYCSILLNLDIPWVPSCLTQRSNRIHRLDGTHAAYHVVNLTVNGTIEAGLLAMIEAKIDLADALLGEKGGRQKTTGRGGENVIELAMQQWAEAA